MDVSTIVQRVIDLGLNENAPDTNLQSKALGWLNSAYAEVYNLTATYAWPQLVQTVSSLTVTNGSATLPNAPRRIISIRDKTTNRVLKQSDYLSIQVNDPDLNNTGNPSKFYIVGTTGLRCHPLSTTTVCYDYVPQPNTLAITDAESAILILPSHHSLLIWSSLVEGMTYERGFGNESLLQVATARKKELIDDYTRILMSQVGPQRVQVQDY